MRWPSSATTVIVVDASVVAPALADDGPDGVRARARLRGEQLAAPELIDLEVASVLRAMVRRHVLAEDRAQLALDDLRSLPMRRASHSSLLTRCWELRANLTCYDAAYVALAEGLSALLLTADARLANAPGLACSVEVIGR
jgi:predicted nucleic acid-binding protein